MSSSQVRKNSGESSGVSINTVETVELIKQISELILILLILVVLIFWCFGKYKLWLKKNIMYEVARKQKPGTALGI